MFLLLNLDMKLSAGTALGNNVCVTYAFFSSKVIICFTEKFSFQLVSGKYFVAMRLVFYRMEPSFFLNRDMRQIIQDYPKLNA